MIRGRPKSSIRDEPQDCAQGNQGVLRRVKWNRSDAYCGKKISLVNPMRLAKKQNNTIDKSAVINSVKVSFHELRLSMTLSTSGL